MYWMVILRFCIPVQKCCNEKVIIVMKNTELPLMFHAVCVCVCVCGCVCVCVCVCIISNIFHKIRE